MFNPLVSVIIPMFNAERFISETIQSVKNQTYKNWEIIIIDDGSTDNSSFLVENLNNPRIKLINVPNGGASKARNIGIRNAKGFYIQFLDADDILSPNKIEDQVKIFESNNHIDLCFCKTIVFTHSLNLKTNLEVNSEIFDFETISGNELLKTLLGINIKTYMIPISAYLVKKELIDVAGEWNETLTLDDDGEFFSRVLNCSKTVAFDKKGINYYRKFHTKYSLSQQIGIKYMASEIKSTLNKLSTIKKDVSIIEFNKIAKIQYSLLKYKYYYDLNNIDFVNIDYELNSVGGFEIKILPTFKGRFFMKILGDKLYFLILKYLNQIIKKVWFTFYL
jgi:glycosyltransferase involved in cell wall biosynthesis